MNKAIGSGDISTLCTGDSDAATALPSCPTTPEKLRPWLTAVPVYGEAWPYLFQVDPGGRPPSLAPVHPVPSYVLQGTGLVHLHLRGTGKQVSPTPGFGWSGRVPRDLVSSWLLHSCFSLSAQMWALGPDCLLACRHLSTWRSPWAQLEGQGEARPPVLGPTQHSLPLPRSPEHSSPSESRGRYEEQVEPHLACPSQEAGGTWATRGSSYLCSTALLRLG